MKCYICNRTLSSDEVKHTPKHGRGDFAPCGTCESIISEVFEPLDEEQLDYSFLTEDLSLDYQDDSGI
jgi:hypothetical protein